MSGTFLYGGGRVMFDQEPSDLKPWGSQAGVEFRSPQTFWGGGGGSEAVAALDVQNYQENAWRVDLSARAGIPFESMRVLGRNLQLLLYYFNGNSPTGSSTSRRSSISASGCISFSEHVNAGGPSALVSHVLMSRRRVTASNCCGAHRSSFRFHDLRAPTCRSGFLAVMFARLQDGLGVIGMRR